MNRNYLRAIPREWRTISRAFTALGDEHRQRILLTFERGERLNVGQIVEVSTCRDRLFPPPQAAEAFRRPRFREGRQEVFYWVNKAFLESLEAVLAYIRKRV
jgi:hypothetical protein